MRHQSTRHLRRMSSAFLGEAIAQLVLGALLLLTRYRYWSILLFALAATCAFIREFYLEELRRRGEGDQGYWVRYEDDEDDEDDDCDEDDDF